MPNRPSYFQRLKKRLTEDPSDQEYMGNIWGWKFSIAGLILIIIFGLLLAYRTFVMEIPISNQEASPFRQETEQVED
ncbi:MAG: hypothetical protein AAF806_05095 [Bacteroidota bacterium]